ncbi:MAG: polysaccharide lyase family 1 protein [Polyangia bacterium]
MHQPLSAPLLACLLLSACGSGADPGGGAATGGTPGSGGVTQSGGTTGRGGSASGGATGTGGQTATGGAAGRGTGGNAGNAGTTGGQTGTGGATGGRAGQGGTAGTASSGSGGHAGTAGSGTGGTASGGAGGSSGCTTPPPGSALVGWAAVSGMNVSTTTGGGSATPQVVTTASALASAASGTSAAVIYVKGVLSAAKISIGSNKTIVGLCGAEVHGHLGLSGSSNVIIRNLKIVGYGVGNCALDPDYDSSVGCSSGNDAITVNGGSHHVWFDHCDVSDGTDGNLDITNGSDFVTVSWTKFHYTSRSDNSGNDSTGAEGHRFSNLIGASDGLAIDVGHLNVTWHHDWWAENVSQRMPRTRAGKIHLYDNLFTSAGNSYCTNAGDGAHLLVEDNVYSGVKAPLQVATNGDMLARNNSFVNTSGTTTATGTGFVPPYSVTPDAASAVEAAVRAGAGPQ